MKFTAVMPSIYPLWTERCLLSMSDTFRRSLLIVDNTIENKGVPAAWNIGVRNALEFDSDWLVIVSAAMRFGPAGGNDFLHELNKPTGDAIAVEAGHGVGWHLIAFPRHVLTAIGEFDENFFAYYEDNDYARRIHLAFGVDPPYWNKTHDLDLAFAGWAHGIDLAGVQIDNKALRAYFQAKWGAEADGHIGGVFPTPFNDFEHDVTWWPTPPDPRSIMEA